MRLSKLNPLLAEIESILQYERTLLLSGELHKLDDLREKKQIGFERLANLRNTSAIEIESLKKLAERNHELFAAALAGLKDAQRRVLEIKASQNGFATYDKSGSKALMQTGNPLSQTHKI